MKSASIISISSYNDTKKRKWKAFYHGLIMGMGLYLERREYITKSNIESGLGKIWFLIEPNNKSKEPL